MSNDKQYGKSEWVSAGVLAVIFAVVFAWWYLGADDRSAQAEINRARNQADWAKYEGLRECRKAIKALAIYGKDSDPGSTGGIVEDGIVFFSWPHGSFHFQNAFGSDVPQSALCAVKEDTGEVLSLAVSGQIIIE